MNLEYLRQAEVILSKCGRPRMRGGVSAVPIPKGFLMPTLTAQDSNMTATTFTKEITGDAPWMLRAISFDQSSFLSSLNVQQAKAIRLQIQLPNGRFLFGGNGVDLNSFAWIGSWRWLVDPEFRFEPGDKISVTLTGNQSLGVVNLVFEGAYLYFMKGGERVAPPVDLWSLPRYQGTVNENILAPAWMSNEGIYTPPGVADDYYIYSSPDPTSATDAGTSFTLVAGAVTAGPNLFTIQIDPGYEFFVRRLLFDVQNFGTATGSVMGRIRTGAGYALNNQNIDLAHYLNGAEFAGQFKVKGGDSVYIDTVLLDPIGTGNVTFQVHLEGYRRRRA